MVVNKMFYDTHTHLNADDFKENYDEIIKEANSLNVKYLNIVGFDKNTNFLANQIAKKYENIFASAGLHPTDVNNFDETDLREVENYLKQDITVAVGECGLDYYWHKETRERQIEFFKKQIDLSKKYNKPLIIHVRDAMQDAYDVLYEASKDHKLKGVMHCYSGSSEMANRFVNLGLYISLGGPVTFKNAKEPKEVAKIVPLDRLLIETDCPFLAPHPYRGKQNKPVYVTLVAEEIAALRGLTIEEVGNVTTNNAKRLFNIK
ncbi:MAG: TatD family deoxyribonuclease [Haloplasmataceae bacterium]|jgi:TatD DNase family protein|nr:TatD family deoxyribonuclease [Haloplasmataceae bacterium]